MWTPDADDSVAPALVWYEGRGAVSSHHYTRLEQPMGSDDRLPRTAMRRTRRRQIVVGAVLGFSAMAMALSVDAGLTYGWPAAARAIWVAGMILGIGAGVILVLHGAGLVTTETLAMRGGTRRSPSFGIFTGVYAGMLIGTLLAGFVVEHRYGIDAERTGAFIFAGIFLLASTGCPWWLYATVRRLGWFAAIESDRTMRIVLVVLGFFLGVYSIYGRHHRG